MNVDLLEDLLDQELIPVIAPVGIGVGDDLATYNINADTAAGAVAKAMKASQLLLLTDVPGVLAKDGSLFKSLTPSQVYLDLQRVFACVVCPPECGCIVAALLRIAYAPGSDCRDSRS